MVKTRFGPLFDHCLTIVWPFEWLSNGQTMVKQWSKLGLDHCLTIVWPLEWAPGLGPRPGGPGLGGRGPRPEVLGPKEWPFQWSPAFLKRVHVTLTIVLQQKKHVHVKSEKSRDHYNGHCNGQTMVKTMFLPLFDHYNGHSNGPMTFLILLHVTFTILLQWMTDVHVTLTIVWPLFGAKALRHTRR